MRPKRIKRSTRRTKRSTPSMININFGKVDQSQAQLLKKVVEECPPSMFALITDWIYQNRIPTSKIIPLLRIFRSYGYDLERIKKALILSGGLN